MKRAEIEAAARKPYGDALKRYQQTLEAIRARIKGEYDHPSLVAKGPLSTNMRQDIIDWINETLR